MENSSDNADCLRLGCPKKPPARLFFAGVLSVYILFGGLIFGTPEPEEDLGKYPVVNDTQEKEDAYDLATERALENPTGVLGTVAYVIKGALGAGILGSHSGFAAAGLIAVPLTCAMGIYMTFCLSVLVSSAQVVYRRTAINTKMSYSDVGEAAFAISPNGCIKALSKPFRYFIDTVIMLDLFGACCCYQLMIAGTIKQIVENSQTTSLLPLYPGYPSLKLYLAFIAAPMILVCMIRNLTLLAKFSIIGNILVLMCIGTTVYYSLQVNPSMKGMKFMTSPKGIFIFTGQTVFSMSASGIVISLECNIKDPNKFTRSLCMGMFGITTGIITLATFGYSAYGELCKSPVTFHFPMTIFPKCLKIGIALMLVITHAANFWVPFNLAFHYIKLCHKEERHNCIEFIYRALFCGMCTCIAVVFPSVNKLMSFLGAFCLSNMAFIFPAIIWLTVYWHRPGMGFCCYRFVLAVLIIAIGLVMFSAGTYVSVGELIQVFKSSEEKIDELDYPETGLYSDYYDHDIY